jgi:hypothetical protein
VSPNAARGDALIEHILRHGDTGGEISNDLIGEFYKHDYPVKKLIPLLCSENSETVRTGAFLVEELGAKAAPLLPRLVHLLDRPDAWVKSGVLSAVLVAATDKDGEIMGRAVSLISDDKQPIRRKVFELMARIGATPLAAGVPYVNDLEIASRLEWVLKVEGESRDDDEIASRLREPDALGQIFAAIAAARVYRRNPHYLQLAASLSESDTQSLAASELAWLSKLDEQAQRRRERAERQDG